MVERPVLAREILVRICLATLARAEEALEQARVAGVSAAAFDAVVDAARAALVAARAGLAEVR